MTRRRSAAALAAALMIAQTAASSLSRLPAVPNSFVGIDKVMHAGLWMILGACLAVALPRQRWRWAYAGLAIVVGVGFGMLDEFHQSFVPGRDSSALDVVADFTGATIGAVIATWYGRRTWRSEASVE